MLKANSQSPNHSLQTIKCITNSYRKSFHVDFKCDNRSIACQPQDEYILLNTNNRSLWNVPFIKPLNLLFHFICSSTYIRVRHYVYWLGFDWIGLVLTVCIGTLKLNAYMCCCIEHIIVCLHVIYLYIIFFLSFVEYFRMSGNSLHICDHQCSNNTFSSPSLQWRIHWIVYMWLQPSITITAN